MARRIIEKPKLPLLAEWYAFLHSEQNDVAQAYEALLYARSLGADTARILREEEWRGFIERHALTTDVRWAALFAAPSA